MTISISNIDAALREEDIESLIAAGAPGDEYSSEAKEIATALARMSKDELTEATAVAIISLVWTKSFNRSDNEIQARMPAFVRIVRKLLQAN